jgi:hypothetical protein
LKFEREVRSPAMQAGLGSRRLSFREVFTSVARTLLYALSVIDFKTCSSRIDRELAAA